MGGEAEAGGGGEAGGERRVSEKMSSRANAVCLLPNSWIQHGDSAIVSGHKVVGGGSHRTVILPADSHRLPRAVPRPWKLCNTKTLCPGQLKTVMLHTDRYAIHTDKYDIPENCTTPKQLWYTHWQVYTTYWKVQHPWKLHNTKTVMIHTLTGIHYTLTSTITSLKTAQHQNSYDTHTDRYTPHVDKYNVLENSAQDNPKQLWYTHWEGTIHTLIGTQDTLTGI